MCTAALSRNEGAGSHNRLPLCFCPAVDLMVMLQANALV
ncbi:hypothetical protein SAMN05446935_3540 [Burkholderia sp. YR290]|nr:hypothetical protein SAMN05446934_2508 [Paraburkholderia hospita]SOE69633.1 hypothetical protein SAMN05446935_3540 [Burkholderia sp. YR290]